MTTQHDKEKFLIVSTTEGRQKLHDHSQSVFGQQLDFVAYGRYRRVLGALTSMDAIAILAGEPERVDPHRRKQIEKSAQQLMAKLQCGE